MGSAFLFYFVTTPTSLTYRAIYLPRKLQLSSALPTSILGGMFHPTIVAWNKLASYFTLF